MKVLRAKFSERTLAWMAGLWEGDGCVRIATDRRCYAIWAQFMNTDESLVKPFLVWGGIITHLAKPGGNRKERWEWKISSRECERFLKAIRPFVRGNKRERIALALKLQASKGRPGCFGASPAPASYIARQRRLFKKMRKLNRKGIR